MDQAPFISVIVPCYNQAIYVSECLESVLDQTYQNWECIIVNDGSPDKIKDITLQWCEKDSRFIYLEKCNGGLSDARNAGIDKAKGEWILPLDADDKIEKDYLRLANDAIEKDSLLGLIYCNARFFGELNSIWELGDYDYKRLLYSNHIFCSAFFRKSDWKLIGGYDVQMKSGREDWEFWIRLLSQVNRRVLKLNYMGFNYRQKVQSMDKELNKDKNNIIDVENYIFEKHKNLYLNTFGTFQQVLYHESMLENKLDKYDDTLIKIRENIITRILYKIISLFI